jgi:hypothetical protein
MNLWIKDNMTTTSVIALIVILQSVVINILVLMKQVNTTETNTTIILQNSNAMAMVAVGYFFVASKRSKEDKPNIQVDNIENVDGSTLNIPDKKV